MFLDMSKAFDKVWYKGLIFKFIENGVWFNIETGVPQGSVLGPLLFLIYINDLSHGLSTSARLFADDVSLFSVVDNVNVSATNLNSDLSKINAWANYSRK